MNFRRIFPFLFPALLMLPGSVSSESLTYRLGLSLVGRGIGAGTCVLSERDILYEGRDAVCMQMTMTTGKLADLVFMMRDTITSVQTPDGIPIHYCKTVNEKSTHNVETADFNFSAEGCGVRLLVNSNGREVYNRYEIWKGKVYDMLSLLKYARTVNSSGKEAGYVIKLPMVNGEQVVMQHIVYEGNENIRDEAGNRHNCLRLSIRDYKYGSERETLKIYVTDDSEHIPVRLDIILKGITIRAVLAKISN